MRKFAYLTLGWVAVILGAIGVVLPGLPTTPFMLVAAFAFSRSSPRWRAWLLRHNLFGPPIRDWEQRRAIARRAKVMAISAMVLIFSISLFLLDLPLWALVTQGVCLSAAGGFILTRPN